jgi:hypothetical protein
MGLWPEHISHAERYAVAREWVQALKCATSSLQVVSSPEASLGALEGMVLYKTPLWDAIPLNVV